MFCLDPVTKPWSVFWFQRVFSMGYWFRKNKISRGKSQARWYRGSTNESKINQSITSQCFCDKCVQYLKVVILKCKRTSICTAHFVLSNIYPPKLNWSYSDVVLRHRATFFCRKIDFFAKKLIFGAYFIKFDQISKSAKNWKNHDFWLFFWKTK